MIKELTHVLDTFLSCIDLIFTSQPNLIIESGVHSSLHPLIPPLLHENRFITDYKEKTELR